jgi:sugar lactone lactonase YvrE
MNNHRIKKFTNDGKFITKWGSQGSGDGEFVLPLGIDADSSNNIYVIDQGKGSLELFTSNGTFIPLKLKPGEYGHDGKSVLEDVEIDPSGHIYIADRGEDNIKKYTKSQVKG